MHQPFLASASAQLNYMTTEELREIFSDDDKLEERINEIVKGIFFFVVAANDWNLIHSQLKSLENEKDVIISENRNLAESNLEMEPKLIEIRSRINDLTQEGKDLSQSVQEKLQQISESFLSLTLSVHLKSRHSRVENIEYEPRNNARHSQGSVGRIRGEKW